MSLRNIESELMRVTDTDTYTILCSKILCPKKRNREQKAVRRSGLERREK